jgi:hypothetical protein
MPARLGLGVEDGAFDAVKVEKQRQHKADRPAADDRDWRCCFLFCIHAGHLLSQTLRAW